MTASGTVLELSGGGMALVRVPRESACGGSCAACGGCDQRPIDVRARNRAGAVPGDRVIVQSGTAETLRLCFVTYLLPVLLFVVGWCLHPAAGVASVLVSVAVLLVAERRLKAFGGSAVEIIRVLEQGRCSDM